MQFANSLLHQDSTAALLVALLDSYRGMPDVILYHRSCGLVQGVLEQSERRCAGLTGEEVLQ